MSPARVQRGGQVGQAGFERLPRRGQVGAELDVRLPALQFDLYRDRAHLRRVQLQARFLDAVAHQQAHLRAERGGERGRVDRGGKVRLERRVRRRGRCFVAGGRVIERGAARGAEAGRQRGRRRRRRVTPVLQRVHTGFG